MVELMKSNIFLYTKILQLMGRICGIGGSYRSKFWIQFDSVLFAMALIWFGSCTFLTEFCWPGCNGEFPNRKMIALLFIIQLIQFGAPICVVQYRCSNRYVHQIFHFYNRLGEKNARLVSFKYTRRNFVLIVAFLGWMVSKVIQIYDVKNMGKYNRRRYYWRFTCVSTSMWPLMILSWQFLAWMQVFNCALRISTDELKEAIIKSSQGNPGTNHELQIIESVFQVKAVLRFKMKILRVYGLSIVFSQFKSITWIMSNAFWFLIIFDTFSKVMFLGTMLLINIPLSYLPHWVGQEISSEVSIRVYYQVVVNHCKIY